MYSFRDSSKDSLSNIFRDSCLNNSRDSFSHVLMEFSTDIDKNASKQAGNYPGIPTGISWISFKFFFSIIPPEVLQE